MLLQYRNNKRASFHVPGHKNGQAYASCGGAEMLADVMQIDVTEIIGTDDLHHPQGIIKEAQELAADCFGAEESYLLVGGSTVGNIALILTLCTNPGDILIVQRNVHKSVLHGLMLASANAVFLEPQIDPISGLATSPTLTTITKALEAYPQAKGVLLTMPNYYGMGIDLMPITGICHQHDVPLIVDEAHGAHYGHHEKLPQSALFCGADAVVQSTHKMLSALTMGSMLHVQGARVDRDLLRQRLAMLQSSSPSYPLMASLDLARRQLHLGGADTFTAGLSAVNAFKRGLALLPRFGLLQPPQPKDPVVASSTTTVEHRPATHMAGAYTTQDPFKAVIYDVTGVLGGYELQQHLEVHGCIPEMNDERYVVLLFSLGSTLEDVEHLLKALQHISVVETNAEDDQGRQLATRNAVQYSTWNKSRQQFSTLIPFSMQPIPSNATESIPLAECEGKIAAEMIVPYPPGIPLLYAGEHISREVYEHLLALEAVGAKCHGASDSNLHHIKVFKNERKQEK
ncbi:aminotransferase class I/II-fold pyridoxal phosphate-dependent enzyme [Paenibacillus sp. CMAA1364]